MNLKSLAVLSAVVVLVGCTLPNSTISNPGTAGITGNWELTATTSTGGANPIGIYLIQSGSTLSGIAWVQEAFPLCIGANGIPCAFPFGVINPNITGTISADGNIVLGSTTSGSTPATFSITAKTTANTTLSGTYSITLGSASNSGTVSGSMIAPVNGTYAGNVVSSYTRFNMGVTMTVSELAGIDSNGFLHLTGSANFTGSPCFSALTMGGPPATYSNLLGNSLSIEFVGANNSNISVAAFGAVSPDAKTIQFHYGVVGGGCANDVGGGTLTLQ